MKLIYQKCIIVATFTWFLLTLFTPQTIILGALTIIFIIKAIEATWRQYVKTTIINIIPEGLKNKFTNSSIQQFLYQMWMLDWMSIIKIFFKQVNEKVELQMLHQQQFQQKHENQSQTEQFELRKLSQIDDQQQNLLIKKQHLHQNRQKIQKIVSSTEESHSKRKLHRKRNSGILINRKFIDEEMSLKTSSSKQQQTTKIKYLNETPKKQKFIKTITNQIANAQQLFSMFKYYVQARKVAVSVQKVNNGTVFKIMSLFWILMIIQIKMSPQARRLMFKTLYIISGLLTILGILGTTGVLIYKSMRQLPPNKQQKIDKQQY